MCKVRLRRGYECESRTGVASSFANCNMTSISLADPYQQRRLYNNLALRTTVTSVSSVPLPVSGISSYAHVQRPSMNTCRRWAQKHSTSSKGKRSVGRLGLSLHTDQQFRRMMNLDKEVGETPC